MSKQSETRRHAHGIDDEEPKGLGIIELSGRTADQVAKSADRLLDDETIRVQVKQRHGLGRRGAGFVRFGRRRRALRRTDRLRRRRRHHKLEQQDHLQLETERIKGIAELRPRTRRARAT